MVDMIAYHANTVDNTLSVPIFFHKNKLHVKPNLDMASRDLGDFHNHGVEIDSVRKRVKCNYCEKEISGFHRLKCHLAWQTGDVVRCDSVPADVKEAMKKNLDDKKKRKLEIVENTSNSRSGKRKSSTRSNDCDSSEAVPLCPEVGTNDDDGPLAREAKKTLGNFFYLHGYDISDIDSPQLRNCAMLFGNNGSIRCIPSSEELKGWIFQEAILLTEEYVNGMRKTWETTGCTVLLDGWINSREQTLVNILVYSPKGTVYLKSYDISTLIGNESGMQLFLDKVIQDVGVRNVVQIVTYASTPFMKLIGSEVMKKYTNIFWAVSASLCIERMLETLKNVPSIQAALQKVEIIGEFDYSLIKHCKMPSMEPYFTLENIFSKKDILKDAIDVAEIVGKNGFWVGVDMALKASLPFVRMLQEIHESNAPQTGNLYELFRQTRTNIQKEFKHQLKWFVEKIEGIGSRHLYSPIHSVGDFLNPFLPYPSKPNTEEVIVNMARDQNIRELIRAQVKKYGVEKKSSRITAENYPIQLSPADWWSKHGGEYPELQTFAIRILSQTCDGAEKFKLRREVVDNLFSGEKKDEDRKKLGNFVYVQFNLKLQEFDSGKGRSMIIKKHSWFGV